MSNSTKAKKLALAAAEFRSYDNEGNECWEVETILDRKYSRAARDFLYLVKWKGWRVEDSTWEPADNLLGSFSMLEEFEKNYQELVIPLEPAYAIIGPESHPITIDDIKKPRASSGLSRASPLSKTKKDTPQNSEKKSEKKGECKPGKNKDDSNKANNAKNTKKKSQNRRKESNETLKIDSSNCKPEESNGIEESESLRIEVKAENFDRKQGHIGMENVENPEIRIQPLQFSQETTCKQEPSDYDNRTMRPMVMRQGSTGVKSNDTTDHSESQMNEKSPENQNQPDENNEEQKEVGNLTVSMIKEMDENLVQGLPMEVEPHLDDHNEELPFSQKPTPDVSLMPETPKEPTHILVGGLVSNFSSSKSLTMPDQVCFGRSELRPTFEQPKPKTVKNNTGCCTFFTEKTKGLSRVNAKPTNSDIEFMDFYSPPNKFPKSSRSESSRVRLGKLSEPNRVRYKQHNTAVPDVGFDWKDIIHWANNNKIVVGAVSEMKNKIRKAMEAEARKTRQKSESEGERSESRKKTTKLNKSKVREIRTEEKENGKRNSGSNRELSRDRERDERENSVKRTSRRFKSDEKNGSEMSLEEILRAARRRRRQKNLNGETLESEDDDFDGIKLHLELNFGYEDEQRAFGSTEGLEDNNDDEGWGLGTMIFIENNTETDI